MDSVLFISKVMILIMCMVFVILMVSKPFLYDLKFYRKKREHGINWWVAAVQVSCLVYLFISGKNEDELIRAVSLFAIISLLALIHTIVRALSFSLNILQIMEMVIMQLLAPLGLCLIVFALAGIYYHRENSKRLQF
ncbi:MAG: hypothetical protein K6A23_10930 [Butyrivibrio sp.]|nr:hypothetical protein [Butyrivibrio sp.]